MVRPRAAAVLALAVILCAPASVATASDAPEPAKRTVRVSGTPTLTSPSDGASSSELPVLAWTPVPHAVRYHVDITQGTTRLGPFESRQTRFSPPWELPAGTYSWRVRASGVESAYAPWSASRTFTKVARLTGAPSLAGPSAGATMAYPDGLVLLRWQPVPWAGGYQLGIGPSPPSGDDGAVVVTSPHHGASPALSTVSGATAYWRVRAVTGHNGIAGPWSATRSYSVSWSRAPTLVGPSNGADVSAFRFEWRPLAGAVRYDLQVAALDDTEFTHAVTYETDMTWVDWTGSVPGDAVRWRVRGRGAGELTGPWSEVRTATRSTSGINPAAPSSVTIPAVSVVGPTDGATGVVPAAHPFDWNAVPGATGYEIQFGMGPQPFAEGSVVVLHAQVAPVVPWYDVQAATTYTWRIRGTGPEGATGPWTTRSFTTAAAPTPDLLGPADNTSVPGSPLVFTWTARSEAPTQRLFLSKTPDFATPKNVDVFGDGARAYNAMPVGTWYWRTDAAGSGLARTSSTRLVTITDDTPPGGQIVLPDGSTESDTLHAQVNAEDLETDVTHMRWSVDGGVTWSPAVRYEPTISVSLVSPEVGGTEPGLRRLSVKWRNGAGLWSAPLHATIWYRLPDPGTDTEQDIASQARTHLAKGVVSGTVPVRVSWKYGQVGIAQLRRFDVQHRLAGGTYKLVAQPTATSITRQVSVGSAHEHRIRAIDWAGNVGPWSNVTSGRPVAVQNSSSSTLYQGSWTTYSGTTWWGGSVRSSSTRWSTATLTFTGREIGWVSRPGPNRGRASVYIDGAYVATVDLYSPTYLQPRIVWTRSWADAGGHTIMIKVLGTAGRPRIDHDGFVRM